MRSIKETVCDRTGKIKQTLWIEWQHKFIGYTHCKDCLQLDDCWFLDAKKPELPPHYNCHCCKQFIDEPQVGTTAKAFCPIEKFSDYIFGTKGIENGKTKLFELLGFTKKDAEILKSEYERQAVEKYCRGDYELGILNEHGQRINIRIEFNRNGKALKIKSGWMVRPKGLITNNTPYGGK